MYKTSFQLVQSTKVQDNKNTSFVKVGGWARFGR